MDKILLDMQSGLFAKAIQRTLSQELDNYQVIISEHPDKTVQHCKTFKPYALLMEATGYTPWMLVLYTGDTQTIEGRPCLLFALGTDREDQFVREQLYAVSDNLIYVFDTETDQWQVLGAE